MRIKRVLIPLPSYGFDPSEAAIPWKLMSENNIEIVFITPDGRKAAADKLMITGERLGIWKSVLRARQGLGADPGRWRPGRLGAAVQAG